jgi:hypothetical protein
MAYAKPVPRLSLSLSLFLSLSLSLPPSLPAFIHYLIFLDPFLSLSHSFIFIFPLWGVDARARSRAPSAATVHSSRY